MRIVNYIAVAQNKRFLFAAHQIVAVGTECIQHSGIQTNILPGQKGRQNMKTIIFAVQIPLFAGAEMVHQAVIVFLHNNSDIFHTTIDHAGNQKINYPESAGDGHRSNGTGNGQFPQSGIIFSGIYNTHYILHLIYASLSQKV